MNVSPGCGQPKRTKEIPMRGFKGTGTIVSAIVLLMSTLTGGTALGASPKGDYVYQDGPLPPLKDARVYVLEGIPSQDGCTYQYPSLTVGPNETARMQRDIGIDSVHCRKLVEEGIPTEIDTATADTSLTGPVLSSTSSVVPIAATSSISTGYHATWYENYFGTQLSFDKSYITWQWDGSCALSGSTQGEWRWSTGPRLVAGVERRNRLGDVLQVHGGNLFDLHQVDVQLLSLFPLCSGLRLEQRLHHRELLGAGHLRTRLVPF
jgi:hypothetical protein